MKLNISYQKNGNQKCIDVDDEKKYRNFFEKKLGQEIDADFLGDEFKGYVFLKLLVVMTNKVSQ